MQHEEPTEALPIVDDATPHDGPPHGSTAAGELLADEAPAAPGPGPLVWLAAGVLVLALIAGVAWFAVTTSRQNREAAMREVATAYVTAIAEADAEGALDLLAERPADTTLITDAVLSASRDAAPITEIAAGALGGDERNPTVDVTYRLGTLPVETTLALAGDARTEWRIADGVAELAVPEVRALTVNGVTLTGTSYPVLPGTYSATAASDLVALAGEPTAVVPAPDHEGARIEVTVGLSEKGSETVRGAVQARFDECLGATESRPANCPFGVSTEGVEVAPGSVRFTPRNDPWIGFSPTFDPATMTAGGTIPFDVGATATVTREGLTTEATTILTGERGYNVDLNQDPAVVTWW